MGKEIYETNPTFHQEMNRLNQIAYRLTGVSFLDVLYDQSKKKMDAFSKLSLTHPCIFMVEYSMAKTLIDYYGIKPDYVLGSSMGEFAAGAIANVLEVEELFMLLIKQAQIFEQYCSKGSMLAVLEDPRMYYRESDFYKKSEIAAINFQKHFVVSGLQQNLFECAEYLKKNDIIHQFLQVEYPFHSSYIDHVQPIYQSLLNTIRFHAPTIPIVSCMRGTVVHKLSNEYFWEIARKPILFFDTIKELESIQDHIYIDLGPGGTLANFIKHGFINHNDSGSVTFSIMTPFNQDVKNLTHFVDFLMKEQYLLEG